VGGAEKVCKDIVSLLQRSGHDVVVATQPVVNRVDKKIVKEFQATSSYSKMRELKQYLDETPFDVYISFGYGKYFSDVIGRFCRRHKKKSIFMPCGDFHTNQKSVTKRLYSILLGRKSFLNYDTIVTATEWEKQHWIKKYHVPASKFVVIPYVLAPDFAKFRPTKIVSINALAPKEYLLYIGRTGPNKKVDWLIKAYMEGGCKIPLVIAGLGTDAEALQDLAVKYCQQNENIKFLGQISENDKKTLISNAKVCVFPSTYESFGMVILESIVLGTPVLLSDIPPFRELIKDNTVFFENTVDSIAERLVVYLSRQQSLPKVNFAKDMNKFLELIK